MNKKKIIFLLILTLFLPLVTWGRSSYLLTASIRTTNEQGIDISSLTTTTFQGTINITTFSGPDSAYSIVLNSIKNAKTSFYLEVYTLSSEPLINALIKAHDRGVDVVVQLSDDRVNSYEDEYTEEAAWRLYDAGIDVYWTNGTEFVFTHAKFWIVDSQEVYVYSGNWAPSSIPQNPAARTNREMGLIFNDAAIASYYENVFFDDGLISTPYNPAIGHTGNLQANETSGTYEHPFTPMTVVEYAEVTPIFSPDNSYTLLSNLIKSATSTIDIEVQYIKFDCDLLNDVIDAALRGVAIRVIIPEPSSSNENVTETLINNGIQVRFFQGLGHDHNKYISVDNQIVQVSSINWSNNSIENNREAGAVVKNANVAAYFKTIFDYDWAKGEIPSGFAAPLSLISPKVGGIVSGSFDFQVGFALNNYTSGELFIDGSSIHVWPNPDGIQTTNVDTTSYSNGVHTIKVVGTPDVGSPIEIEEKINVINDVSWLFLISEVRYDADTEPNGEFVELYNGFDFDVFIEGWKLTDNEGELILPEGAQINTKQVLIFSSDTTTYESEMSALGITAPSADYGLGDIQLANSGDEVILKDPSESIKDAVAWGSGSVASLVSWSGEETGAN
ncbi:MAG: phospholipase D-like domain-containing protein, partial [Candidatus Heimdallarchaeaceae archaeon]